jgi:DNA-directed RNA polymerase specialized sigma24 family protein
MREALTRLVRSMTSNSALRDDLLQEAMVHLWLTETRRPGQTQSWYLQGCKFHLQHYLGSGRSVDSAKRNWGRLPFSTGLADAEGYPEQMDSGDTVLTSVNARELILLLSRHLAPQERDVLHCLADGLGPREIGRKLNMSHTMVIKHRRKIAALLTRLEVPSEPRADLPIPVIEPNGASEHKATNGHHSPAEALSSNGSRTRASEPVDDHLTVLAK